MNNKKCPNCGLQLPYQMRLAVNAKQSRRGRHPEPYGSRRTALDMATNINRNRTLQKSGNATLIKVLAGVGALIV